MKQDYFAFFYGKTHNIFISELFARILYAIYINKFHVQKLTIKNVICHIDNAKATLSLIYPKPKYQIDLVNPPINPNVDISIIVPVYNYREVIPACIDSLINQKTKYQLEIILIDDGSTDGASDICDDYAARNNVKVIHQNNGGIGAARDTGLNHATGKYVMFVDCDDVVHDDFVEIMLDKAYHTGNDIVICGYNLIKKRNGKIISQREIECSSHNLMGYRDDEDLIMNYQGLPWNKICKREIYNDIRYLPGLWYEDTILHFLVFRKCKSFSYVNRALYDYMWYEKNFSHTQSKVSAKSIERYWFLEFMAEETRRVGLPLDRGFYKTLLRHCGARLYTGIHGYDENAEKAAFSLTCDMLREYQPQQPYSLTYFEKKLERALLSNNIGKWRFISQYI